jgi:hypothetical protein
MTLFVGKFNNKDVSNIISYLLLKFGNVWASIQ